MNVPDPAIVERLTMLSSLGRVRELVPLAGGANNRVFRVECEVGPAILKSYFRSPDDPRDRLGAEFAFGRFARAAGIRRLPNPLACDPATRLGLFEYVDGERPATATEPLVAQAAEFVRELNAARSLPGAAQLPLASEACFSLEEHVGVVGGRVNRLGDITSDSEVDREALRFVRRHLLPAWGAIRDATRSVARASRWSVDRPLDRQSRCISPSDFGFHNALVTPDGRATFLDFEYAGWDDPAKLICDFFCQPAVPVSESYFDSFTRTVMKDFAGSSSVIERARLLLPVYRVKWVCIRLNEFLPDGNTRRNFSKLDELEGRRHRQLTRARAALASLTGCERISA